MKLTTEQIQKAYIACFGRSADVGGFEYWKEQDFENEEQIYQLFVNSNEGQSIYSGKTDEEIIEIIYQNVLGRDADIAGKAFWLEQWHTMEYGLDVLIQNITQAAINNGELTQSLINNAINETKITQINLASVIALDRPATAQEIKENLNKDCYTYNYVKIFSQTIEFMANGRKLDQILQEKIDFTDLNAELDNAIKSDVPTDYNYFFNNNFQKVKLLISAWEYPKNLNSQIFSNEVLISKELGFDMLKHIDNSSSYIYKLFKYNNGLDLVKQQLKETATELTNSKDISLIPKFINTIIEPNGNQAPEQDLTIQYVKFTDNLNDGILNSGDYLTISFSEKVKPFSIQDLELSNNHSFGSNPTIEAINPDKNGYTSSYKIILGDGVNIASGDIITINKDKIVDVNGKSANENMKLTLTDILSPNIAPGADNEIKFTDTQKDNVLNANDSLTITFSEPIDTKNLKISDFILSNHSFGDGASISPINVDNSGFAKEIKIILGNGVNITNNDIITIKKDKIVDKDGLSATKNIIFTLKNIPNIAKDTSIENINSGLNVNDKLNISFNKPIKVDSLTIDDISLSDNTHNFGEGATIRPKNPDEHGYASEFEIILGDGVKLENTDKIIINKNAIEYKDGSTSSNDVKLNVTEILPPPSLNIKFNEKVDSSQLTIDALIIASGNNLGEGATIVPVNPDENGFANEFKIVLGVNPTIEPDDVLIIDKEKVINEAGMPLKNDVSVNLSKDIIQNITPPEPPLNIDGNLNGNLNVNDKLNISFNKPIKVDSLTIDDISLSDNTHNFGEGATIVPKNPDEHGYASEFEIILGDGVKLENTDKIIINKDAIEYRDGSTSNNDVKLNVTETLPPPSLNIKFNEKVDSSQLTIDALIIASGNNLGEGATIVPVNPDEHGYASEFKIILGNNPTVEPNDILIIDKEKVINEAGMPLKDDVSVILSKDIIQNITPPEPPLNIDGDLNANDKLNISFNKPIKVDSLTIDDISLSDDTHNFGDGATIVPKNPDEHGYASEFEIILGDGVKLENTDKIIINKDAIEYKDGSISDDDIQLNVTEILPPPALNIKFNEKVDSSQLTIDALIIASGNNLGEGATIVPVNPDEKGFANEFKIVLGVNPTIEPDDVLIIDKEKVINEAGMPLKDDVSIILSDNILHNIITPSFKEIFYTDKNVDNFTNKGDTITLSFNEPINSNLLNINDLIFVNETYNFGDGAFLQVLNANEDGFASEFKIILGKNPNIEENAEIKIDKTKIVGINGINPNTDIKFNLLNLLQINEPPTVADNNSIIYTDTNTDNFTNKGDTLTLSFNELIKAENITIENLIISNGHNVGEGASIQAKDITPDGYAREFDIILGKNFTILENDVISIDKEKIIDKQGLNASENAQFVVPTLLSTNEPPVIADDNSIIYTDENTDNFTNKDDTLTLKFNEPIKVDEFDITDLILNNGHTFGDGATLEAINEVGGYAKEYKIILGSDSTITKDDVISIDKEKVVDAQGLNASENIEFIVPDLLLHNESPTINPLNSIIFNDENADNFTNKGDMLILSFNEAIKSDAFSIIDLIIESGNSFGNGATLEVINDNDGYASKFKIILGENPTVTTSDVINIDKEKIIDNQGLKAIENIKFIVPTLPNANEPPTISPTNAIEFTDENADNFTNKSDTLTLNFSEKIKIDNITIDDLIVSNSHSFGDGAILNVVDDGSGYASEFEIILGKNPTIIEDDIISIDKEKIIDKQGLKASENAQFVIPTLLSANEPPAIADNNSIIYTDENADNFINKSDSLTLTFNEKIKADNLTIDDLIVESGNNFGDGAVINLIDNIGDGYASKIEIVLGKESTIIENDIISIDKEKIIDKNGLKASETPKFTVPELFPANEPPIIDPLNAIKFTDENADNFTNKGDSITLKFNEPIKVDEFTIDDLIAAGGVHTFGDGATLEAVGEVGGYAKEYKIILGLNSTITKDDVISIDKEKVVDTQGLNASENIEFIVPDLLSHNEPPAINSGNAIVFTDVNADNFINKTDTLTLSFNESIEVDAFDINDLIIESGHNFGDGASLVAIDDDRDGYASEFKVILGQNPTIITSDVINIDKEKIIDNQGLKAAEDIKFIVPTLLTANEPPTISPTEAIKFVDENADEFTNKGDILTLKFNEPIKSNEITLDALNLDNGHSFGDGATIMPKDIGEYSTEFVINLGKNPTIEEHDKITIDKEKIIDQQGLKAVENIEFIIPELKPLNEPPTIDPLNSIIFVDKNTDNFTNKGDTLTLSFNEPIKINNLTIADFIVESGNNFGNDAILNVIDNVDGYASKFEIVLGKNPTIITTDIISIDKNKIEDKDGLNARENVKFIIPELKPLNEPPTIASLNAIVFIDENTDNFTNKGDSITLTFNEPIKSDAFTIDDLIIQSGHNFGDGASLEVINNVDGYASEFKIILGKNPTVIEDDIISIDKEKIIDKQGLKATENAQFVIPTLLSTNEPPAIADDNSIIYTDENTDNFTNKSDSLTLTFNEKININNITINDLIISNTHSFGEGASLVAVDNSGDDYASEFKIILGKNPTILENDVISIDKEKIVDKNGLNAVENAEFLIPPLLTKNEPPTIASLNAIIFTDKNADNFTNKGDSLTLSFNESIKAENITIENLIIESGNNFGDGASINVLDDDGSGYATKFEVILGKNSTIERDDVINIDKNKVIDTQGLKASENIKFIIPELLPLNEPPEIASLNAIKFIDKNADDFTNKGDSITLTFNELIKADEFTIDDLIVAGGVHNFGEGASLVVIDETDGYATKFEIILGENASIEENDVISINKENVIDKNGLKAAENIEFIVPALLPKNEPPKLDTMVPIEYRDENNDNFTNKGDNLTINFNEPVRISELTLDDLIVESGHTFGDGASLVAVDDDRDGYAEEFKVIFGKEPTIEENDVINIDKNKIVDKDGLKAENNIQIIVPSLNSVNEPPEFNNVSFSDINVDNFTNAGDKLIFSFNEKIKADAFTIGDLITDDGNNFGAGAVLNAVDTDISGYATTFEIVLGTHPTIEWDDIVSIDKNKIIDVNGLKAAENIEIVIPHIPNNNEPPDIAHEHPITFTDDNVDNFTNKGDYLLLSFNEPIKADAAVLSDIIVSNGHNFGEGAELIPVIIDNPNYIRKFKIKLGKGSTIEENDTLTIPKEKIIDFDGLTPATNLVFRVPELLPVNEPPEFENVNFVDNDLNSFTNKNDYLTITFNEKIKIADLTIDSFKFENDTHTFGQGASLVAVDNNGDDYASEFKIIFGKNINLVADEKVIINREKVIDKNGLKAAENIEFNIPTNLATINEPPSLSETPIIYEDKNNDNFINKSDGLKIGFNEPIRIDALTIDDLIVAGGHTFGDGASLVAIDDNSDGYAEEFEVILGSNPTIERDDVINIDKEKIIDMQGLKAKENIQLTIPEIYPANEPPVLNSIVFNDEDGDGFAYTGDSLILTFNEKIKISELKLDEISIQAPTHTFGDGARLIAINDSGDGYASEFKIFLGNNAIIENNDVLIIPQTNVIDSQNLKTNQNIEYVLNNILPKKIIITSIEKDLLSTENKYIFNLEQAININDFTINRISNEEITQITPLDTNNNYATKFELTIPNLNSIADVANKFQWNNILIPKYNNLIFNLDKETLTNADNYILNLENQENNENITNIVNVNSKNINNTNLEINGNNKKEINITTQENSTFGTIKSNGISNDIIKLDITGDIYSSINNNSINNIYSGLGNDVIEIINNNRTAASDAIKVNGVLKFTYTEEEITGGYTDTIKGFNELDKIILPENFAVKEFKSNGDLIVYNTITNEEYTPIHIENYTEAVFIQSGNDIKAFFPNYTNSNVAKTYNLLKHGSTSNGYNIINAGSGDDIINITNNYNLINSGDGNDIINYSKGGNNTINSGNGNDTINAIGDNLNNNVLINSGDGDDIIKFNNKNNYGSINGTIIGGKGNDNIDIEDLHPVHPNRQRTIIKFEATALDNGKDIITNFTPTNATGLSLINAKEYVGDVLDFSGFLDGKGIFTFTREVNNNITLTSTTTTNKVILTQANNDVKVYYNQINENNLVATLVNVNINDFDLYNFSNSANESIINNNNSNNIITAENNNIINTGENDNIITVYTSNTVISGDGNDKIWALGPYNSINSGGGNDIITSRYGFQTINSGDGNDTINTTSTDDYLINSGSGNDSILISNSHGKNTINSGDGDDVITISISNNSLSNKIGATISGGAGNDTININKNNILNVKNTIIFEDTALNNGKDTIKIINSGSQQYTDVLDFSAFLNGANTFTRELNNNITFGSADGNKVLATQSGGDVKIYYNNINENNLVATLVGVDVNQLTENNFIA